MNGEGKIEILQEQLSRAPEAIPMQQLTEETQLSFDTLQGEAEQEKELDEEPLSEKGMDPTMYSVLEDDLKIKIESERDPILKANMQWEARIIHSVNNQLFEYGDSYKYYHMPTLPLALLKMESEACAQRIKPKCQEEEMGGYQEVDLCQWKDARNL